MNVSLSPDLEKLLNEEVASGRYKSVSDVIREGLRLLEQRKLKLETLKRDIEAGLDSGTSAPLDIEDIKAEGRSSLTKDKRKTRP